MKRILTVGSIFASAVFLSTSMASAELSAIACSGDSKYPCPIEGFDFFAPTANQKHAEPDVIARDHCTARKKPGKAKGTYLGPAVVGGCCGYRLVRIDCSD